MSTAIKIESVSKLYRLGTVGTGTLAHDLNRWWHAIRGKEDPYAKVGQVNDRTKGAKSTEQSAKGEAPAASPGSPLSALRSGASGPDYVWALRDINLEVQQGEILGIIGRNGAGKSTLLKLLSRITAPTTGAIKTKGRIASLLEVGTGFHPEMTGRENIYMNGAILGMRRHEITRQLDEIVEFSGCAKYLDTPVKRYSSGMTVRLGFAVAAHLESEILIVDEVLAVGDFEFQARCLRKLETVGRQGRSVIFVSHLLYQVARLTTRVLVMSTGQVDYVGGTRSAIGHYLALGDNTLARWTATVGVEGAKHRIMQVSMHGQDGQLRAEFRSDEEMYIQIQTKVPSQTNMQVAIRVNRMDGSTVFTSANTDRDDQVHIQSEQGEFTHCVRIPQHLLLPGRYYVLAALNASDWAVLDLVELSVVFEVLEVGSLYSRDRRLGDIAAILPWTSESSLGEEK